MRGEGRPILPAGEASAAKGVPDREGDEVESDDSDHASVDLDAELEPPAEPAEREVFRGVPWSDCAVHLVSGITHVKRDSSSLLCGCFLSGNYKPFKPGSLTIRVHPDRLSQELTGGVGGATDV